MATKAKTTTQAAETVAESVSEHGGSSSDEMEMRIAMPGDRSATESDADTASVDEDVATEDADAKRAATKCEQCSNRKVKSCVNSACKRCCLRIDGECAVHSKAPVESVATVAEVVVPQLRKMRKPVLKNEFKESNIMYYDETVTLFCLRDFFQAKKLSQPLLNDQTRALRAAAAVDSAMSAPNKRRVADVELKNRVLSAVWGDAKRRKTSAL